MCRTPRLLLIDRLSRRNHGAAGFRATACQLFVGIALVIACQSAVAQAMYRLKLIGSPQVAGVGVTATELNNADQLAGDISTHSGDSHAFLWKHDGTPLVDLGPSAVGASSSAAGLNNSGLVAGRVFGVSPMYAFESSGDGTPMTKLKNAFGSKYDAAGYALNDLGEVTGEATAGNGKTHAVVWKNDGSQMVDLGTLGGNYAAGSAINASGQVAGTSEVSLGSSFRHAFFWRNDGTRMQDIGALGATGAFVTGINAHGQIAGESDLDPASRGSHAFLWRNDGTPIQDLGTLGGDFSRANALNDLGQVTGYATKHGAHVSLAFVWMNNGTPMKSLGTLGGTDSVGNDINSSGMVTGWAYLAGNKVLHAFLWRNDGTKITDLNALIDPTDPLKSQVTLIYGVHINDHGDILAYGDDGGSYLLKGTVLLLNPRSLAFGNQAIHTTSAAKSVTVTNTSTKVSPITNIALRGGGASQFQFTDNCGSALVARSSCTIKVTFKPITKGAKTASLTVNGGGGGLRVAALTGTGT